MTSATGARKTASRSPPRASVASTLEPGRCKTRGSSRTWKVSSPSVFFSMGARLGARCNSWTTAPWRTPEQMMCPVRQRDPPIREKCVEAVQTWFCGSRWERGCLARWTHMGRIMRRVFVCCLADILPAALRLVRSKAGLADGMEQCLERLLAADEHDTRTGDRLRLLKVSKAIHHRLGVPQIAVIIILTSTLDEAMYSCMGSSGNRKPCTLFQRWSPTTSPLFETQR